MRPVRAFVVRAGERRAGVALRELAPVRAVVVCRTVLAVTDGVVARETTFVRGVTVVDRVATLFVAFRGSVTFVVVVRAFVVFEREVVAVFDFCDWMIVFAPRIGVVVETFCADVRDAARAISS